MSRFVAATWIALFVVSSSAVADITSVSVSGPGGTGSAMIDSENAQVAYVSLDFTSVDYLNINFSVSASGFYFFVFQEPGSTQGFLANDTNVQWTTFLATSSGLSLGGTISPSFTSEIYGTDAAWFYGGYGISPGSTAKGSLFAFGSAGTYSIALIPNGPDPFPSVPEPTSCLMLGIGSVALLLARARQRRSARQHDVVALNP